MGPRLLFRAWQGPCDNPSGLGGQGWPDPPPPEGPARCPAAQGCLGRPSTGPVGWRPLWLVRLHVAVNPGFPTLVGDGMWGCP